MLNLKLSFYKAYQGNQLVESHLCLDSKAAVDTDEQSSEQDNPLPDC